ncbi:protein phosphatase 1L [Strongylocentrotus purpuratus]|uniref:Protein phosphatase 1L n=1 Tax=Strongylocentrotus purpuratus TaxID=7668 RepID=A0A7M7TH44_STRPU|nr:protein phosphatase 1L [Strongylocentrotus purpuratus]
MTLIALFSRFVRGTLFKYETVALVFALLFLYGYVFHRDHILRSVFRRTLMHSDAGPGPPVLMRIPGLNKGGLAGRSNGHLRYSHSHRSSHKQFESQNDVAHWELREDNVAVYSIQGRRPGMEDRFDYATGEKDGVTEKFCGIYDGHGGEFAAEFTEKLLSQAVLARLATAKRRQLPVNHSQILVEEILAVDEKFLTVAKSNEDMAGSTALVALITDSDVIVANVGDSRGVMCDGSGKTVPLSYDHKPHHPQERKRIKKAGGFIAFNGVWRVAGILATSRAIGDYPLKDHKFVVADPDILSFDLDEHNPQFLILATDGLWDTFTNEEAVQYIKERLGEPHFGAKSLVLQAFYRGSMDNITVMVVNLSRHRSNSTHVQ